MAAASASLVNSAPSLSPSNPLRPSKLIPLPLTSFSLLSLSSSSPPPTPTTLSQSLKATQPLVPVLPKDSRSSLSSEIVSVLYPSISYSNTLFFKSVYNVEITVDEDEPEEQVIGRFNREVMRAGVIQEIKRRRRFETTQEKRKRKHREAARRNSKRRFPPKVQEEEDIPEFLEEEDDNEEDDDNWEFVDTELPYCNSK